MSVNGYPEERREKLAASLLASFMQPGMLIGMSEEIEQPDVPLIRTFEDLECWKQCRTLRLFLAKEIVPVLPRDEKYRLADQILRAGRSTTSNVAEGYGRFHFLDNAKFCSNARGSCWEVLDHLITADDEGFLKPDLFAAGRSHVTRAVKLLNGYMNYLKRADSNQHRR